MVILACSKDLRYHGRTKHIDIHFHYIWDIVAQKKVVLKHILTSRMMVDPLTKTTIVGNPGLLCSHAMDLTGCMHLSLGLFRYNIIENNDFKNH